MWLKFKDFWKKYESKIVLILGFILISVVSFEAGTIKGAKISQNPVIIEKPVQGQVINSNASNVSEAQNLAPDAKNNDTRPSILDQTVLANCAFVGSKNSNKFHLTTCRWAKNIKPENIVCFKDENEAKSKGYLPDKNCIK